MKLSKEQLQKLIKEEFEKFISLKEDEEKSTAELACEKKAAERGVPMGFNPNTGKCEMLNEE